MQNAIRRIFGSLEPRYLIRGYVIGTVFFIMGIFAWTGMKNLQTHQFGILIAYGAVSTILFPFAKFVWDAIKDMLFGNIVMTYGAWALLARFMLKALVNLFIWFGAIVIAPLGILYLWIRSGSRDGEVQ